jgi:hypothetical protein
MLNNRGVNQHMVEQGTAGDARHLVHMMLAALGAVLGLLVLSVIFGSASASADDGHDAEAPGGSLLGGVVSTLTDTATAPVQHAGAAVSHAIAPLTHAVAPVSHAMAPLTHPVADAAQRLPVADAADDAIQDLVEVAPLDSVMLESIVGPRPVESALEPVVRLIDGTVSPVLDPELPATGRLGVAGNAVSLIDAGVTAVSGPTEAAAAVISGSALGRLLAAVPAAPDDQLVPTPSAGGAAAIAFAMLAAPALLVRRRGMPLDRFAPGSPVYDTDSSPD